MALEPKAIDNWSEVYNLADGYRRQQQWQKAAVAFKRAIQLRPDFFWSYHHLADALGHLQQWQPSAMAYRRAVEIDPSFFWSWHNLGDVLIKLEQWDRAIAVLLQAIQIQSEHQLVVQKLGMALKQRGSLNDSIRYYRRVILECDRNQIFSNLRAKPSALVGIANILVGEHQRVGAIIVYYMALEIQPDRIDILQQLALLLQQQNRLEQNITSRQQTLNSELLTRQPSNVISKPKLEPILGQISLKRDRSIAPEQLEALCSAVGWSPRPLDRVQQSLDNSFAYITVWHSYDRQEQLIGFARAISDGTFHAVLLDVVVHPRFQNRGIGKTIVKTLLEQLSEAQIQDTIAIASPHVADFYHKLGFVSQPNNLQWMLWCGD